MRTQPGAIIVLVLLIGAGGFSRTVAASDDPTTTIAVPTGNGSPVITDGLFSPGEWDDAKQIPLNTSVTLYLKEWRGVAFIGVRSNETGGIGPSELFVAAPGGPAWKLHVSAQLFEEQLELDASEGAPKFGLTTDWYANEQRRDVAAAERLQKEGRDPISIMRATSYPSQGIEFAIRRSKLPGATWLLFLHASAVVEGKPGMLAYPPSASPSSTEHWLKLRFK